jgi:glycosyltransferase involved in cell wall biosynthesis
MKDNTAQRLNNAPRVSVIMTVYNAEEYLEQSISSVLRQDLDDWELIIVENGSEDHSRRILERFHDQRIRIFYLPKNIGRTPALNLSLSKARSPFIAVLDADDIAEDSRLRKQYAFLEKNTNIGLVGSWAKFIDEHGNQIGEKISPTSHEELLELCASVNPIVHSSVMYRFDAIRSIGFYDETFVYAQDFRMISKLAVISRLAIIPEFLCCWRSVNTSMTKSSQFKMTRFEDEARVFRDLAKIGTFKGIKRVQSFKKRAILRLLIMYNKKLATKFFE